jgi:hypothetical protein
MKTRTHLSQERLPRILFASLLAVLAFSAPRLGAFPIITNVVQTAGDGNRPTAKFTGQTFVRRMVALPSPTSPCHSSVRMFRHSRIAGTSITG